jgi:hypothetical protein
MMTASRQPPMILGRKDKSIALDQTGLLSR